MFASTLTRRITSSQVARRNMSMFDVKNTIHATREKFYLNPGKNDDKTVPYARKYIT